MEYLIVGFAALLVAVLTLFSGFGLGTLLMPVFALFFPVEVAVAATAVVHAANNTLKLPLFARDASLEVVKRFGLPAILAAFAGAALLGRISGLEPLVAYGIGGRIATVTPVKLVISVLIFTFALFDLIPRFRKFTFDTRHLPLGGVLSGFFGGLSGHQGALRSAFLVKTGLSTKQFVGTNAVIGFLVDLARILVYGSGFLTGRMFGDGEFHGWGLVGTAIGFAFAGSILGKRLVGKVTMKAIQVLTGVLLLSVSIALGAGLV
jgi:uncharacterized membrane protein YfcA